MLLSITTGSYNHERTQIAWTASTSEISFILQELQNYTELSHPRLPTDEAIKSIYDDIDTTDKCILLCVCRLTLVSFFTRTISLVLQKRIKKDSTK